jgi:hypothetical protein
MKKELHLGDLAAGPDHVADADGRRVLEVLRHEDGARAGELHRHEGVQRAGLDAPVRDERFEDGALGVLLVKVQGVRVARDLGIALDVGLRDCALPLGLVADAHAAEGFVGAEKWGGGRGGGR